MEMEPRRYVATVREVTEGLACRDFSVRVVAYSAEDAVVQTRLLLLESGMPRSRWKKLMGLEPYEVKRHGPWEGLRDI